MRVLLLYDYPPSPSGLATQGDLLYKGLLELGVEAYAANIESALEKEWYYRWFKPDVVVGIGYWGHTPQLILHPQQYGIKAVPWLVADGYIAHYQDVLNALPLILVTSNWVKDMYVRDGVKGDHIEVLPVGCNTDTFIPYSRDDPKVMAIRASLGIDQEHLMILTVGGDAASKGGHEVMLALAAMDEKVPDWKYVCKLWPQQRTHRQNREDLELAVQLGIDHKVVYSTSIISRQFMPYLLSACDIYAAPSRLEGFGMLQVEAGACGKPVIGIGAMGMLDTMIHEKTALLAGVAEKIVVNDVILGPEIGFEKPKRVVFKKPRTVDYRADVQDIRNYLELLMKDVGLRNKLGKAARARAVKHFDYRVVTRHFVQLIEEKLNIK